VKQKFKKKVIPILMQIYSLHISAKEQESMMRSILMPFSFGPRMCIGNKLATAEMRLVLASLLQNFTFSPVPGFPEVTPKIQLTTKPHPSLKLRIRPAS